MVIASLALVLSQTHEARLWFSYQRHLYAAHSLYVREIDHLHKDAACEYWALKPNLLKIKQPDGTILLEMGNQTWQKAPGGTWTKLDGDPSDVTLPGAFRGFFEKQPSDLGLELAGKSLATYNGRKVRTFMVKTTESAIFFGTDQFLSSNGQPIGHHATERNDVTTDSTYDRVMLNIKINRAQFAVPK